ncbi:hypothetical protein GCM10023079_27700 [Streptomyces chitinivorans]
MLGELPGEFEPDAAGGSGDQGQRPAFPVFGGVVFTHATAGIPSRAVVTPGREGNGPPALRKRRRPSHP